MKYYQSMIIVTFLLSSFQADAVWPKWVESITSKINNVTDVIHHKEFAQADQLELHNQTGTIVINSWKQNSIAIEVIVSCPESSHKDIKIDMESIDNIVKIHTNFIDEKLKASVVFNILLPKETDITITTKQGDIVIKDVNSQLYLETKQGDIKLVNPHNTVIATAVCGNILMRTDSIETSKTFSLISNKGNIEIYTTPIIDSYIYAYAPQGKILSDLPITLDSKTTVLNPEVWKSFRQIVHGSIGKPDSKITLIADNGSIAIMPYIKQNDIF
ncbi:hypothetical protein KBC04_04945 [Candidatus Babeliales bacterium]|nr:hypothetical protein [Candidatus Babeliales bacterium]MBP9844320.1 hypothetical protein [Candidatus Babeliales bacterium]